MQGTNSDGKETVTQINALDQKEERNIQPKQNEETRIQKNEERFKNLRHNFKRSNTGIRILIEIVEYGHKIEEKMKALQSAIKENVQGTNSEGKETGTQINYLEQKEEINIRLGKSEDKKVRRG